MICPNCGAENPDNAVFCTLCYARFASPDPIAEREGAEREIEEKYKGFKLLCPNCQEISPVSSQFCLRCGFIFDNRDDFVISEEAQEELSRAKKEQKERELEKIFSAPIVVTPESDGAETIRSLEEVLKENMVARIHARGREAIAYSVKIIALLSGELEARKERLKSSIKLLTEDPLVNLYDLEVEFILEVE